MTKGTQFGDFLNLFILKKINLYMTSLTNAPFSWWKEF